MQRFISSDELGGLNAFLREVIYGEKLTLQPAVFVHFMRWSMIIKSAPVLHMPVGSEGFAESIVGRIPPNLLNRIANDAGFTLQEVKQKNALSLWDLIATAAEKRKKRDAARGGSSNTSRNHAEARSKPSDGQTPDQKTAMLAMALLGHHKFESSDSSFNESPATGLELVESLKWSGKSQVSRHFKKIFGGEGMAKYKRLLARRDFPTLKTTLERHAKPLKS